MDFAGMVAEIKILNRMEIMNKKINIDLSKIKNESYNKPKKEDKMIEKQEVDMVCMQCSNTFKTSQPEDFEMQEHEGQLVVSKRSCPNKSCQSKRVVRAGK